VAELDKAAYDASTRPMRSHINVGSGEDLSIRELAGHVARAVGFAGRIECDPAKPDGAPRKLLNVERLRALGWKPRIGLAEGLDRTYRDFLARHAG
jgi:GDP-L-fucose synthase